MKLGFFIGIMALAVWACSPVRQVSKSPAIQAQCGLDSSDYEVVITDPRFDQWYITNYSGPKDHSNDYYRGKNLIAVSAWNDYYRTGKYGQVIDSDINYHPETDYGIGVNRKLFWYFKFVTVRYGIPL